MFNIFLAFFISCILILEISHNFVIVFHPLAPVLYSIFSLSRIGLSLVISVVLSLIIAKWMSNCNSTEIIEAIVDVLQSIPILSFLAFSIPNILPDFWTNQIYAIFGIIAAQIWNIIISVYNSLKYIPKDQINFAKINNIDDANIFFNIELPRILPGLSWNCMLSLCASLFAIVPIETSQQPGVLGIGKFIYEANKQARIDLVAISAICIFAVICLLDKIVWSNMINFSRSIIQGKTLVKIIKFDSRTFTNLFKISVYLKNFFFICLVYYFCSYFIQNFSYSSMSFICLKIIRQIPYLLSLCAISFLKILFTMGISTIIAMPLGIYTGINNKPNSENKYRLLFQLFTSLPINIFNFVFFLNQDFSVKFFELLSVIPMILSSHWYMTFSIQAGSMFIKNKYNSFSNLPIWTKISKIYIPSIIKEYIPGLISACGAAWNATIFCEYVSWHNNKPLEATGIGNYLVKAYSCSRLDFFIAVFVMSIFIALLNRFFWYYVVKMFEKYIDI